MRGFARLLCDEEMKGFVDVGSGLGKLVLVAAALKEAPCWGVELSPLRAAEAKRGLQQMRFAQRAHVRQGRSEVEHVGAGVGLDPDFYDI